MHFNRPKVLLYLLTLVSFLGFGSSRSAWGESSPAANSKGQARFSATASSRKDANIHRKKSQPLTSGRSKKKIVFIAGTPSHGFGAHEHRAGCLLLAEALNDNMPDVHAVVSVGGWPKDPDILNAAATIVAYCDGGGRHPFNKHIEELDRLMQRGVGMVCLHYAVEVPKGQAGDAFLRWIGGYFETDWSVNPHWLATFSTLPNHPVTRGVKPFQIRDEWYYHMRFRKNMEGVTPILTALPPAESLTRKDGAHSNNPTVRAAVLDRKEPQHLAWAYERPDGGRGFGFTGGHFHWNWAQRDFRTVVLNAIVWTAHIPVPKNGVPSQPVTLEDLLKNQDFERPATFNPASVQKMLDEWNGER